MAKDSLFPEVKAIVAALLSEEEQDSVTIIVPSHDKNEKPISNQELWADGALDLLGQLYGGATAFQAYGGTWLLKGKIYHDKPILVESYAQRTDVMNEEKLKSLLQFAKRMGQDTRQHIVAIVINTMLHEIKDFKLKS